MYVRTLGTYVRTLSTYVRTSGTYIRYVGLGLGGADVRQVRTYLR